MKHRKKREQNQQDRSSRQGLFQKYAVGASVVSGILFSIWGTVDRLNDPGRSPAGEPAEAPPSSPGVTKVFLDLKSDRSAHAERDASGNQTQVLNPHKLSFEDLVKEVSSPQNQTLSQRSLAIQFLVNHAALLSPDIQAEVTWKQLRTPLVPKDSDDSDAVFYYFFNMTDLYLQKRRVGSQSDEQWAEAILGQPSAIARKAILLRLKELAPNEAQGIISVLIAKGLNVGELDESPVENRPELDP